MSQIDYLLAFNACQGARYCGQASCEDSGEEAIMSECMPPRDDQAIGEPDPAHLYRGAGDVAHPILGGPPICGVEDVADFLRMPRVFGLAEQLLFEYQGDLGWGVLCSFMADTYPLRLRLEDALDMVWKVGSLRLEGSVSETYQDALCASDTLGGDTDQVMGLLDACAAEWPDIVPVTDIRDRGRARRVVVLSGDPYAEVQAIVDYTTDNIFPLIISIDRRWVYVHFSVIMTWGRRRIESSNPACPDCHGACCPCSLSNPSFGPVFTLAHPGLLADLDFDRTGGRMDPYCGYQPCSGAHKSAGSVDTPWGSVPLYSSAWANSYEAKTCTTCPPPDPEDEPVECCITTGYPCVGAPDVSASLTATIQEELEC